MYIMWRYLILFPIAVVTALTVYVAIQDQHYTNTAARERTQFADGATSTETHNEHSNPNTDNPKGNPPSWYRFFAWPDGVTVWAIFLTLIVIAKQTVETAKAADAALLNAQAAKQAVDIVISKERCRIGMKRPDGLMELPYHLTGPDREIAFNPNRVQQVDYRLNCYGLTVGYILEAVHGACISDSEEPPTVGGSPIHYLRERLDPTDPDQAWTATFAPLFPRLESIEDVYAVVEGRKFIHLWGHIRYKDVFFDVFRQKRITAYRYVWKFTGNPTDIATTTPKGGRFGTWVKCGPPEDNRAN
ncbi:MAG: hypothetical protein WBY78_07915 [Terriglobales bacterium]|jgi:hypothetical protein